MNRCTEASRCTAEMTETSFSTRMLRSPPKWIGRSRPTRSDVSRAGALLPQPALQERAGAKRRLLFARSALAEHQLAAFCIRMDGVAGAEFAGQNFLRERVFQLRLDRALQRTRAIDRIEAGIAQQHQRRI